MNASSMELRRWSGCSELEQQLYLSLIVMDSSSRRWRRGWRSSVHEQSDNGVVAAVSELSGGVATTHDARCLSQSAMTGACPADFEKAIRSTEMALFTNLYLLIHGKFFKTSVIQSVELCEYYNFAIMIMD